MMRLGRQARPRGLILCGALLTAGCVVGYRDLPDLPDRWGTVWTRTTGQYETVGHYRTLERRT